MATAELQPETDLEDFADDAQASQESHEVVEQVESPEQNTEVETNDEYDFDANESDTPGESDPPTEAAATATEPADSGVVDDGESFPPELLKLANLDERRARAAFGTPERLEQAWLQSVMQAGRQAEVQSQQQHFQQSPATPPPPPETAPTQQELEDYLRLKLELPPEFADVEDNQVLFDALGNQVSQFYGSHFKRLEDNFRQQQQVLQHFVEREQREQVARHDEEFDRFIEGLPNEWHELFGEARPEIGTPQHQARAQLFHAKSLIENGTRQLGQDLPLQRALELGLRTAFPDKHDTIIRKSVTDSRRGGPTRLARPNSRRSAPPTGDQAAIEKIGKLLKEKGHYDEQSGLSSDDFI
jgi:hypothetical protein